MLYRISKYDPENYDENGTYTYPNEWTDFSQIGRDTCTPKLTFKDYLRVESNYLATLFDVATTINVKFFTITQIERQGKTKHWWKPEKKYDVSLLCDFLSDCLRNKVWGVTRAYGFICFTGWDYYCYLKCDIDEALIESICTSHELYCVKVDEMMHEDIIDLIPLNKTKRFYHS